MFGGFVAPVFFPEKETLISLFLQRREEVQFKTTSELRPRNKFPRLSQDETRQFCKIYSYLQIACLCED